MNFLLQYRHGLTFKSKDTVDSTRTQLVRMGNLYQNILDLNRKPVFYPDEFAQEYSQFILEEGDLIMSLTGTVGKRDYGYTVEIPKVDRALLLNQRISKLEFRRDILDKRFFLYQLRSKSFLDSLYGIARGVRQANLSTSNMKELPIMIPSMSQQIHWAQKMSNLEKQLMLLESGSKKKLHLLQELKQSILHKAFSGELTSDPIH